MVLLYWQRRNQWICRGNFCPAPTNTTHFFPPPRIIINFHHHEILIHITTTTTSHIFLISYIPHSFILWRGFCYSQTQQLHSLMLTHFFLPRQEDNEDSCAACAGNGELVCCDGCPKAFHYRCCDPPIEVDNLPDEYWCNSCRWQRNLPPRDEDRTLFQPLLFAMSKSNPKVFLLPASYRDMFVGVRTGPDGEYEPAVKPKIKSVLPICLCSPPADCFLDRGRVSMMCLITFVCAMVRAMPSSVITVAGQLLRRIAPLSRAAFVRWPGTLTAWIRPRHVNPRRASRGGVLLMSTIS